MPCNHGQGAEDVDDNGMTPRSFQATTASTATKDASPISTISSPPASPVEITKDKESSMLVAQSRPHGKRRDPSYIPRPPNAFILFRSAFIRDQNIPGKVEGNHSKLSKIIGICWRQLPPEEREKWEAQAVIAQAEHRARYPDWRFRPGANAMAKLKVSETSSSAGKRRSVRSRVKSSPMRDDNDGDSEGKVKDKGKGKAKANRLPSIEETRCAKIAGFVTEGLKGDELEVAVKQWEDDRRISRPEMRPKKPRVSKSRTTVLKAHSRPQSGACLPSVPSSSPTETQCDLVSNGSTPTRAQRIRTLTLEDKDKPCSGNAGSSIVNLSDIPLTHMFKRSNSVSASNEHLSRPLSEPSDESSPEDVSSSSAGQSPVAWGMMKTPEEAPTRTHTNPHVRPDPILLPIPSGPTTSPFNGTRLTWQEAGNRPRFEEIPTSDSWWTGRSTSVEVRTDFSFSEQKERQSGSLALPSENIGFNAECSSSQYAEQYRPFETTQDCNQHVGWTTMSASGADGEGVVTVIEDPYDDDCEDNRPVLSQPQTLSLPPPTNTSFYHSSTSQPSWLSSSYSALTGWDGDYKHHQLQDSWPDQAVPNPPHMAGSTNWYSSQGMYDWTGNRPQLDHTILSVDPHDWDRLERRAMNDMHHRAEPPRQLPFHDPHGGS